MLCDDNSKRRTHPSHYRAAFPSERVTRLVEIAPYLAKAVQICLGREILREQYQSQNRSPRFGAIGSSHRPGAATKIPELANAMDILVHPSRAKGSPALPQGAVGGCPAVTYDIDGAKEGVSMETGFVLPPFDKARLADALAKLLGDALLRREMGAAGASSRSAV